MKGSVQTPCCSPSFWAEKTQEWFSQVAQPPTHPAQEADRLGGGRHSPHEPFPDKGQGSVGPSSIPAYGLKKV